ncbi:methyl-accepting chemotaxis protein [Bdellovibrio bacteriovorus]|uniref:HAMP domain-containing methyl-accepting chemotaxis protein n=1 Tax=Bdellovibrio bacteriovorus TaxID=959 RepID=UPI0035A64082
MSSSLSWFRGLRGKLLFSAVIPLAAFAILTGISVRSMNTIGGMLENAYTNVIPNMDSLGQIGMQRARVGYFMWAALALTDNEKGRNNFIAKAEDAWEDFKVAQEIYEKSPSTPETDKIYEKTKAHKAEFHKLTESMIAALKENTPEANQRVMTAMNGGEWHILALEVQKATTDTMAYYQKLSREGDELQKQHRRFETQLLIIIAAFCSLAIFAILMFIAYRVSKSVSSIASNLTDAGHQVSAAIVQLTSAGQTLSHSSTESAASLEETVASLEEMSSMVKMNSDNAKQAAALSQSSKESAEQGQTEIQHLISSMHEISKSSKKIEEIISVIDDIAFQTNLLALNASVEAARAGEHGKGFAVVAEAVRALAQRSAVAAKDINGLIKDSVDKVGKGSEIADKSGEVLFKIVSSVKKVSDLNNEIAAASSEQTTGLQQINKAMNQLDQGAQANAASSEEIAASAEEINAQALQMKNLVNVLNSTVLGSSESSPEAGETKKKPELSQKVVPFQAKKTAKPAASHPAVKKAHSSSASSVIPFDEDEGGRGKVGTTDGF